MPDKAKDTAKAKKSPNKHTESPSVDFSKPLENTKHERFSQEYHKTLNSADAYRVVYPKTTQKGSEASGPRLLGTVRVAGRIAYLQSVLSDDCGVTAKRLMEEWAKIGFGNSKAIMDSDNTIKDISKLPDDVAAAISSVSVSRTKQGKNVKVTFHSKESALENMGKRIGFYEKHQSPLVDALKQLMQEIGSNGSGLPIKT